MSNFNKIAAEARKELRRSYLNQPITKAEFFGDTPKTLTDKVSKRPRFVQKMAPEVGDAVRLVRQLSNDSISAIRIVQEGALDKCIQLSQYLTEPAEREMVKDAVNRARRAVRTDHRFLRTAEARARKAKEIQEGKERAQMERENAKLREERNRYELMLKAAGMLEDEADMEDNDESQDL